MLAARKEEAGGRRRERVAYLALGLWLIASGARADEYPSRPITLVVPYAAAAAMT